MTRIYRIAYKHESLCSFIRRSTFDVGRWALGVGRFLRVECGCLIRILIRNLILLTGVNKNRNKNKKD